MSTSFGSILGTGVPFAYASNLKAYCGSLRNLPTEVEAFDKSDIPDAQLPFNAELLTAFASRVPLANSSLNPTCRRLTLPFPTPDGDHYLFHSGE